MSPCTRNHIPSPSMNPHLHGGINIYGSRKTIEMPATNVRQPNSPEIDHILCPSQRVSPFLNNNPTLSISDNLSAQYEIGWKKFKEEKLSQDLLKYQLGYYHSVLSKHYTKRWEGSLSKSLLSVLHIIWTTWDSSVYPKHDSGLGLKSHKNLMTYIQANLKV